MDWGLRSHPEYQEDYWRIGDSGASQQDFTLSSKSFWSCTHVNSCQKYTLYINLHILLNILSKTTSNIQESRKSINFLKR